MNGYYATIVKFPDTYGPCREPGCTTRARNFVLLSDARLGPWCSKHANKVQAAAYAEAEKEGGSK